VGQIFLTIVCHQVEKGANVDLPLWLAQDLFSRQAAFIKLPYFFSDRSALISQLLKTCLPGLLCSRKTKTIYNQTTCADFLHLERDCS
jgi:hypothetical protein